MNNIFLKVLTCLLLSLPIRGTIVAQQKQGQFRLEYIAVGEEMEYDRLKSQLEDAYRALIEEGTTVVYYLSQGSNDPVIVEIRNNDDQEAKRKEFEEQILNRINDAIQSRQIYSARGDKDKQNILALLNHSNNDRSGFDIINSEGDPIFKQTWFEFYVGQNFWDDQNNETLLASLFFELNLKKYIDEGQEFHFNVFAPQKLKVRNVFGLLNPDNCKSYINLERTY